MAGKKDGFKGKIGENVKKSKTEIEENILRILYEWWIEGRELKRNHICSYLQMTRRQLAWYLTSMTEHGYLEKLADTEYLQLTDFGKQQGADCHRRHRSITHFIQITCGLDEKKAKENACRMEHIVSSDVIEGIYRFLKTGELYDSVIRNVDFKSKYAVGDYSFRMAIYQLEQRYPRILAAEWEQFDENIRFHVGEKESCIYIKPLSFSLKKIIWYKKEGNWKKTEKIKEGYCIPAEILTVTTNGRIPIMEGKGIIGFTETDVFPTEKECRELNIFLW